MVYAFSTQAFYTLRRVLRVAAGVVVVACLPACSTQLGPIFGSEDGPTGSITPRDGRFSNTLNDADWKQAQAALQTALETPTSGQAASWSNPDTGMQGTVTAVGQPFARNDETCNAFVATIVEGTDTHWFQGRACHNASNTPWNVAEVSAWKPPKAK